MQTEDVAPQPRGLNLSHAQPQDTPPAAHGLYDPRFEHDACGVSFVVDVKGRPSRRIVELGLGALCNLEHRGATGAEADTGDGAGILIQMPDRFLRSVLPFDLPAAGSYAVGLAFLPTDGEDRLKVCSAFEALALDEGLRVAGWREVPVEPASVGATARRVMPAFKQVVVVDDRGASGMDLERKVFVLRKRAERSLSGIYFPSLSCRTLIYKGMLNTAQLGAFFPDLRDERVESALALVHSRFSTNTFPSWPLAHPVPADLAHNGEINTVHG